MKKEEKIICDFMFDFVDKNWAKINKGKSGIKESKIEFLKIVKSDINQALWVLTEVCSWAMNKKYLEELYVDFHNSDECNFFVIKIKNKYIKIEYNGSSSYIVNFVKPEIKKLIYF